MKKLLAHNNPGNIDNSQTEGARTRRRVVKSNPMKSPVKQQASRRSEPKLSTKAKKPSYLEVAKASIKAPNTSSKKHSVDVKVNKKNDEAVFISKKKKSENKFDSTNSGKVHKVLTEEAMYRNVKEFKKASYAPKKKTPSTIQEYNRKITAKTRARSERLRRGVSSIELQKRNHASYERKRRERYLNAMLVSKEKNASNGDIYPERGVKKNLMKRLDKTNSDIDNKNALTSKIEVVVDNNLAIVQVEKTNGDQAYMHVYHQYDKKRSENPAELKHDELHAGTKQLVYIRTSHEDNSKVLVDSTNAANSTYYRTALVLMPSEKYRDEKGWLDEKRIIDVTQQLYVDLNTRSLSVPNKFTKFNIQLDSMTQWPQNRCLDHIITDESVAHVLYTYFIPDDVRYSMTYSFLEERNMAHWFFSRKWDGRYSRGAVYMGYPDDVVGYESNDDNDDFSMNNINKLKTKVFNDPNEESEDESIVDPLNIHEQGIYNEEQNTKDDEDDADDDDDDNKDNIEENRSKYSNEKENENVGVNYDNKDDVSSSNNNDMELETDTKKGKNEPGVYALMLDDDSETDDQDNCFKHANSNEENSKSEDSEFEFG